MLHVSFYVRLITMVHLLNSTNGPIKPKIKRNNYKYKSYIQNN